VNYRAAFHFLLLLFWRKIYSDKKKKRRESSICEFKESSFSLFSFNSQTCTRWWQKKIRSLSFSGWFVSKDKRRREILIKFFTIKSKTWKCHFKFLFTFVVVVVVVICRCWAQKSTLSVLSNVNNNNNSSNNKRPTKVITLDSPVPPECKRRKTKRGDNEKIYQKRKKTFFLFKILFIC
jgi:hypothetical protein